MSQDELGKMLQVKEKERSRLEKQVKGLLQKERKLQDSYRLASSVERKGRSESSALEELNRVKSRVSVLSLAASHAPSIASYATAVPPLVLAEKEAIKRAREALVKLAGRRGIEEGWREANRERDNDKKARPKRNRK